MRRARRAGVLTILLAGSLLAAQRASGPVEWLYYGGDQGGMRYSPLADIHAGNLQRLQPAWQWKHWETPPPPRLSCTPRSGRS